MAESDRRPGESERDWMRRITRLAGQQKQAQRDEAIERRLKGEAQHERIEQRLNSESDQDLQDFYNEFGIPFDKVEKKPDNLTNDELIAIAAIQKNIGKRGLFGGNKYKEAKRKHKKALKSAAKKQKGFCSVVALGLLSLGGGIAYGMYEGASAIISAMGR